MNITINTTNVYDLTFESINEQFSEIDESVEIDTDLKDYIDSKINKPS